MKFNDLLPQTHPSRPAASPRADKDRIVLTSRIRLARNLSGHPFPGWSLTAHRQEVLKAVKPAAQNLTPFKKGFYAEMEDLSPLERQFLVERHLISLELAARNDGCAVLLDNKQETSLMINEEDHLRLQIILPGLRIQKAWEKASRIDDDLERTLRYAFSPETGYLTACPSNLGTGLRASTMLHLPGLMMSGNILKIIEGIRQLGLTFRGLYGEGSHAYSNIFQLSNQATLGESESVLVNKIDRITADLVSMETRSRQKLLEDKTARIALYDQIGRAYGILSCAHSLGTQESLNLISLLRLGSDLGVVQTEDYSSFDLMLSAVCPALLQLGSPGKKELPPEERDILRASLIRNILSGLPRPDFR